MDPIIGALAVAVGEGFVLVITKLLEEGFVKPALEPATGPLADWVRRQSGKPDRAASSAPKAPSFFQLKASFPLRIRCQSTSYSASWWRPAWQPWATAA